MATLHVRNVPDDLYEALRARAEGEGRSIGAQTVTILTEALVDPKGVEVSGGKRRFRRRRGGVGGAGPLERFSQPAREVVVLAQEEARRLGHDYLGTEHLLLALAASSEPLLRVLELDAEAVRGQVERVVGEGPGTPPGPMPFTPRSKKVLELALREALGFGDRDIDVVHVLLALAEEKEGIAAQILGQLGATPERIRSSVAEMPRRVVPTMFPPPHALTFPTRWEYSTLELEGSAAEWSERLNALAGEGWELMEIVKEDRPRAVFRRPARPG